MNRLSIAQLEQFSGIKAHTIRIWEQRYNTLKPHRSEGNTRWYDGNQLRRLLNIVSLMNSGHKVAELSLLTDRKVSDLIHISLHHEPTDEYLITQLIAAGMSFDEPYFEKMFSTAVLRHGLFQAYVKVICPALIRVGLLWSKDVLPPAQEHFISNLIRQKLFAAVDGLPPAKAEDDAWLLFLPEDEFHDVGLLFSSYLIRAAGKKVIYLGSSVPVDIVKEAVKQTNVSNLLLFMVHNQTIETAQDYISSLSKVFRQQQICIGGQEKLTASLKPSRSMKILRSPADLKQVLSV